MEVIDILLIIILYLFYQLIRNTKVFLIRDKWLFSFDNRIDKYTYEEMFLPSPKNIFGFKFPQDKHFK